MYAQYCLETYRTPHLQRMTHPDYRRWLDVLDGEGEEGRRVIWYLSMGVIESLVTYSTGEHFRRIVIGRSRWERELSDSSQDFPTILPALLQSPIRLTQWIQEYLEVWNIAMIMSVSGRRANLVDPYEEVRAVRCASALSHKDDRAFLLDFEDGLKRLRYHPHWRRVARNVAVLGFKAGRRITMYDDLNLMDAVEFGEVITTLSAAYELEVAYTRLRDGEEAALRRRAQQATADKERIRKRQAQIRAEREFKARLRHEDAKEAERWVLEEATKRHYEILEDRLGKLVKQFNDRCPPHPWAWV